MTAGGAAHPVWWDENLKWRVLLGATIAGEVRVRGAPQSGKLARLAAYARDYDTFMHLYANNCRVFAARMRREAARAERGGRRARRRARRGDGRRAAARRARARRALAGALPARALLLCGPAIADIARGFAASAPPRRRRGWRARAPQSAYASCGDAPPLAGRVGLGASTCSR